MKLSDYVWRYIEKLGTKHVFMFPGGGAMHLVDSLGRNENLEYVTLLHEQACAMAAETYAKINYCIGVVLVTTGPGGTNALTGVAAAWLESTPVLVISGQVKTEDLKDGYGVRQRGNQEIGIIDIVNPITKYAVTIKEPDKIRYYLDRAVYEAHNGRPGPVWIDIPLDIQAADVVTDELAAYTPPNNESGDRERLVEKVKKTAALFMEAKKPVIIAGQGIERKNGKRKFRELADRLQIPVLFSWVSTELLEYGHACNLGKPGIVAPRYSNFTMQDADLVIAIGTRLDPAMIGYNSKDFAPHAKKIVVDIDHHELDKFEFEIELKIQADATDFIEEFLAQTENVKRKDDAAEWLKQCQDWKKKYPVVKEGFQKAGAAVNPYDFVDRLSDALAKDDVVIPGSSGAGIDIFWLCYKNKRDQRALAAGALGSMGYGIPAAIGACLASGKRTICIEGDGSIQLNIQEFASIAGMKLPIKIFVNGNGGYLSIMNMQRNHFSGNFVGADSRSRLYLPDLVKVAHAYGFQTFEIHTQDEADQGIKNTLEADGPALCYVYMRDDITIQPKVMSKVMEDGSMVSGSLRDLWPFLDENGEGNA